METQQLLMNYIRESEKARQELINILQVPINSIDIQLGLAEHFGLEDSVEILFKDLDSKQMLEILKNHDFSKPTQSEEIWLEESILPAGLPRLLTEEIVKHKGEKWEIHKYDKDTFPSNPHAHNFDANVKLHLGTGELFNKKKELVGKLKLKQLQALRDKVKNIELPPLAA